MDTFNIIAGLASIISLLFAAYEYHKNRIYKAREEGNIRTFTERLRNVNVSLKSTATILQILIRRADSTDVPVPELQNLARAARANLYGTMMETNQFKTSLREWKFGELLDSTQDDKDEEQVDQLVNELPK